MSGLPLYTYMIGVCVAGICDWHETSNQNIFTSMRSCEIAGEIVSQIANDRYLDQDNYAYYKINYQCYNWWSKKMDKFKAQYGFTKDMGY